LWCWYCDSGVFNGGGHGDDGFVYGVDGGGLVYGGDGNGFLLWWWWWWW
jgi:hypothetical protein